ncbi:unnamed protein product [Polarella glacialis]|uniref:Uncharacterized protein n=1 Tax=Polarella glacialis TaxID=89957 RepID=A0A813KG92_POLGL|nr:unnamed protein product [Polarella glacialis]
MFSRHKHDHWCTKEFYQAHIADLEAYCQGHLLDEGDCYHVCLRSPCPHDHGAAKFRRSRTRSSSMMALPLNMHVVVAVCIKPLTSGCEGVLGYALLRNGATPQRVQTFVSHSWGQSFHDFVRTLQTLRPETVLWICSFALPQNIDISSVLGMCPGSSPFATALQRAERVVLAVDEVVEPLGRTWCCYEMYLTVTSGKRLDIRAPRTSISLYRNIQDRVISMDIRLPTTQSLQRHMLSANSSNRRLMLMLSLSLLLLLVRSVFFLWPGAVLPDQKTMKGS